MTAVRRVVRVVAVSDYSDQCRAGACHRCPSVGCDCSCHVLLADPDEYEPWDDDARAGRRDER